MTISVADYIATEYYSKFLPLEIGPFRITGALSTTATIEKMALKVFYLSTGRNWHHQEKMRIARLTSEKAHQATTNKI